MRWQGFARWQCSQSFCEFCTGHLKRLRGLGEIIKGTIRDFVIQVKEVLMNGPQGFLIAEGHAVISFELQTSMGSLRCNGSQQLEDVWKAVRLARCLLQQTIDALSLAAPALVTQRVLELLHGLMLTP